ncbi:MAG: DUF6591 domain-containing protein [Lachnospiraceae bacterium]|jgi:hypothetical protein
MSNQRLRKKHLIFTAAALLAAAGVLAGCGGAAETNAETTVSTTADANNNFADSAGTDETESADTFTIQAGRLLFDVPDYYSQTNDNSSNGNTDIIYSYFPQQGIGSTFEICTISANGITSANLQEYAEKTRDSIIENYEKGGINSVSLTSSEETKYKGMPGFSYDCEGTLNDISIHSDIDLYLDESSNTMYLFLYLQSGSPKKDVASDYVNMMKNAKVTQAVQTTTAAPQTTAAPETEAETEAPAETAAPEEAEDSSGVSPEVKDALDTYEAMMNEYCDIMERYENADASEVYSMLDEYTSALETYSEAMDKLDSIDEDSLSTADYEYYIDVTSRVSKRLLEVSQ